MVKNKKRIDVGPHVEYVIQYNGILPNFIEIQ